MEIVGVGKKAEGIEKDGKGKRLKQIHICHLWPCPVSVLKIGLVSLCMKISQIAYFSSSFLVGHSLPFNNFRDEIPPSAHYCIFTSLSCYLSLLWAADLYLFSSVLFPFTLGSPFCFWKRICAAAEKQCCVDCWLKCYISCFNFVSTLQTYLFRNKPYSETA